MPEANLDTTNLLLGILAAASVLEALLLVASGILGCKLYSEAMTRRASSRRGGSRRFAVALKR